MSLSHALQWSCSIGSKSFSQIVVKFWAMFLAKPESQISLMNGSVSSIIQEGSISPLDFKISKIWLENLNFSLELVELAFDHS